METRPACQNGEFQPVTRPPSDPHKREATTRVK